MTPAYTYWDRLKTFRIQRLWYFFAVCIIVGLLNNLSILKALLFSLSLSLILLLFGGLYSVFDYIALRLAFRKYGKSDYGVKQYRELEVYSNRNDTVSAISIAIENLGNIRNKEINENRNIIKARRRRIFEIQGEDITVQIFKVPSGNSLVKIWSEPIHKRVIFDLARNYKNVERIATELKASN